MALRLPPYTLRIGIGAYLFLLLLTGMLLINLVWMRFLERDLLQERLNMGWLLVEVLGEGMMKEATGFDNGEKDPMGGTEKQRILHLLERNDFSKVLWLDRDGVRRLDTRNWGHLEQRAMDLCRGALKNRNRSVDFQGTTWGVFWPSPEWLVFCAPVSYKGALGGAVAMAVSLRPVYKDLRKSQKVVLLYTALNAVILVFFGVYLFSRTVVRPILRLLTITDKVKREEDFPLESAPGRNEIGQLYRSMNLMVQRLEANRRQLQENIVSLKTANQQLQKAQEEIVRSEKMASIGRLSAGLAHEIGNPLGVVLGYVGLLKRRDLQQHEIRDSVERIETEVMRINRIIRDLLSFSRPSSAGKMETSVHPVILDTLEMLAPQPMMQGVEVRTDLMAIDDRVWAGPDPLKQVLINVMVNALDAMGPEAVPGAGDPSSQRELVIQTENREGRLVIRIQDTGKGIPPENLARIFDPFYTTKEPGKGTGLGLAVSYRLVEDMGGTLEAESSPGKGTTIRVSVPLCQHMGEEGLGSVPAPDDRQGFFDEA